MNMDILPYIAFSFKGIKNSYHVQMSAVKFNTMSPCCLTLHHSIAFVLHHY